MTNSKDKIKAVESIDKGKDIDQPCNDKLGIIQDVENDKIANLRSKLDLRLLPLLCITYALQSIDKTTLGYAAVFGLETDLALTGTEYSWLGSIFYLGYLIWEFPTNIMLQKLPINYFMSATVTWKLWDSPDEY